jgi:hypothetical protein
MPQDHAIVLWQSGVRHKSIDVGSVGREAPAHRALGWAPLRANPSCRLSALGQANENWPAIAPGCAKRPRVLRAPTAWRPKNFRAARRLGDAIPKSFARRKLGPLRGSQNWRPTSSTTGSGRAPLLAGHRSKRGPALRSVVLAVANVALALDPRPFGTRPKIVAESDSSVCYAGPRQLQEVQPATRRNHLPRR